MRKWLLCRSSCGVVRSNSFYCLLWTYFLLFSQQWFIRTIKGDSVPATTKYREVTSVSGSVGQIPCPVTSFDDVVMILWFKGSSGAPIYSYDSRNEDVDPRHMTLKDDWGIRLYFRVWPNNRRSPALMIQDLKPGDGGLYRCRVDYRNSPTTNAVTRLKIIEPPTRLEIRDTSPSRPISDQQIMMTGNSKHSDPNVLYMGPYTEGQNVTLICSAYGGRPLPEVRWYKNGEVVDVTYSLFGTEYAINEMEISNLGRNHASDIFSCQASNNNETQALTHKVHLDIYLGVTSVELEIPSPMTAGTEYSVVCKTIGAYPTVKVEFWKNSKRMVSRSQMKSVPDNVTMTTIQYKPEVLDDGSIIVCKAENPWISKKPTAARKTMKIKYAPVVVLRLGRNRTTAFTEGESVLMECHVKANPPAHTILWFHQGRQLTNNGTTGNNIRITGMTLFISYLSHHVGGDFHCAAVSDLGKGISNTLPIELHLSPRCVTLEATQVPLAIGETQWLTCNILAWPSDLNFYWTLNRSDSTSGSGEMRSIRNLTQHHLPSSLVARGINNNVTANVSNASIRNESRKTNSATTLTSRHKEDISVLQSKNQNGYPQLSTESSFESLDYPEDQHIMPARVSFSSVIKDAKTGGVKAEESDDDEKGISVSTRHKTKEKRSNQIDTLVEGKVTYYSTGEKAISEKDDQESTMTHSSSVFSTSIDLSFSKNNFSMNVSQKNLPVHRSKLTADIRKAEMSDAIDATASVVVDSGNKKEAAAKNKRHVYPSSTSSSNFVSSDGRSRGDASASVASGFQDKIRHTSLFPYQVKSDDDYGTVICWAANSFGSSVYPCLFTVTKRAEHTVSNGKKSTSGDEEKGISYNKGSRKPSDGNTADKEHTGTSGNLTTPFVSGPAEKEALSGVAASVETAASSQQGVSKLQKTLGIVLLLILIFIAALSGLAFALFFVLAKKRREIRRIVIAHGPGAVSTSSSGRLRGVYKTVSSRKCVSRNSKGSTIASKNAFGESTLGASPEEDQQQPEERQVTVVAPEPLPTSSATTLPWPCSASDMFVISTSGMDSFHEIAGSDQVDDTNKEEPMLSYISNAATSIKENRCPDNNAAAATPIFLVPNKRTTTTSTFANNNAAGETDLVKDIEPLIPGALMYLSNNNGCGFLPADNGSMSLQLQFVQEQENHGLEEGFKSMTPKAVKVFGNVLSFTTAANSNNNNGSGYNQEDSAACFNSCDNVGGVSDIKELEEEKIYCHLDKDCLPELPSNVTAGEKD